MNNDLIVVIQWPHGDRKIIDIIPRRLMTGDVLMRYGDITGVHCDWVGAQQKQWLREQGFLV